MVFLNALLSVLCRDNYFFFGGGGAGVRELVFVLINRGNQRATVDRKGHSRTLVTRTLKGNKNSSSYQGFDLSRSVEYPTCQLLKWYYDENYIFPIETIL